MCWYDERFTPAAVAAALAAAAQLSIAQPPLDVGSAYQPKTSPVTLVEQNDSSEKYELTEPGPLNIVVAAWVGVHGWLRSLVKVESSTATRRGPGAAVASVRTGERCSLRRWSTLSEPWARRPRTRNFIPFRRSWRKRPKLKRVVCLPWRSE